MSYYLRFICEDELPGVPDLVERWKGLGNLRFSEVDDTSAAIDDESGVIASIELNRPGDGLFEEELAELREDAADADDDADTVLKTLDAAKSTLAFEVLFGSDGFEPALAELEPLLDWLRSNAKGLFQADGEGFYRGKDLILAIE